MTALERAARALYEMGRPASATAEHWNLEWSDLGAFSQGKHREQARAVLMAVRGVDGHGIEMSWWSERIVDAILNEKDATND